MRRCTIEGEIILGEVIVGVEIIFVKKLALIWPGEICPGGIWLRPKLGSDTGELSSGVGEEALEPIEFMVRRRWICPVENRCSRKSLKNIKEIEDNKFKICSRFSD